MTHEQVPVTAVVPSYQPGAYLQQAVFSILSQVPAPSEVIVVDDGSTDGSADRLQTLGLPVRVITQPNAGEGAARNTGLRAAQCEHVALLDADDWWLPGHLGALWEHRHGHSFVSGTMIGSLTGRLHGNPTQRTRRLMGVEDVLWPENAAVASGVLLRRDLALEAGGFSTRKRGADLEMWIELVQRAPALSLPDVTSVYREHAGQVSGDVSAMRRGLLELMVELRGRGVIGESSLVRVGTKVAWDNTRELQRAGAWRESARQLAHLVERPARVAALIDLLRWRAAGRRRRSEASTLLDGLARQVD